MTENNKKIFVTADIFITNILLLVVVSKTGYIKGVALWVFAGLIFIGSIFIFLLYFKRKRY